MKDAVKLLREIRYSLCPELNTQRAEVNMYFMVNELWGQQIAHIIPDPAGCTCKPSFTICHDKLFCKTHCVAFISLLDTTVSLEGNQPETTHLQKKTFSSKDLFVVPWWVKLKDVLKGS